MMTAGSVHLKPIGPTKINWRCVDRARMSTVHTRMRKLLNLRSVAHVSQGSHEETMMNQTKISAQQRTLLNELAREGMIYQNALYSRTNKDAAIRRISKLELRGLIASEIHLADEGVELRRLFLTADGWRYLLSTDPAISSEPWAAELRGFLEVRATARELAVLACSLQYGDGAAVKLQMLRGDVIRNRTYFDIRLL